MEISQYEMFIRLCILTENRLFEDPITFEVMVEAVMGPCGHSFSKESITEWLQSK